jgi:Transposase DDE domain
MELRDPNVRPRSAPSTKGRRSTIDRRATRRRGHALSRRVRRRIEATFGRITTAAGLRRPRFRGLARIDLAFSFAAAACGLAGASP